MMVCPGLNKTGLSAFDRMSATKIASSRLGLELSTDVNLRNVYFVTSQKKGYLRALS